MPESPAKSLQDEKNEARMHESPAKLVIDESATENNAIDSDHHTDADEAPSSGTAMISNPVLKDQSDEEALALFKESAKEEKLIDCDSLEDFVKLTASM